MANSICLEQQLTFTLGIISPLSIRIFGMLMQVSKSVNDAASQWEVELFENNHIARLLSMACTTKIGGRHNPLSKTYYVCTRTWDQWPLFFCADFYIPMGDRGKVNKRKRSFKTILEDYVVHMSSINYVDKKGVIRVKFRGSYKNSNIKNIL